MKCCVVIPIYKETLTLAEISSLKAVFAILEKHEIQFFTYKELNLDFYYEILKKKVRVIYFDKNFFKSVGSYNRLMLNSAFYSAFNRFDYILVYQLDAYVFRDELDFWCSKRYDYIGAPWFDSNVREEFFKSFNKSKNPLRRFVKYFVGFHSPCTNLVGNGGFSLRKISTFLKISKFLHIIEPNLIKYGSNEDIIWSFLVPKYFSNFKIPAFDEALKFSVEQNPKEAFDMLGKQLPFGCHAWEREDYLFWKEYLSCKISYESKV